MKFEDERHEETTRGAGRPGPALADPVDGMLVERRVTAGFADHDGRGRAGGGYIDEDEQPSLDALLAGPARVRRIRKITGHVRYEAFGGRSRGGHGT